MSGEQGEQTVPIHTRELSRLDQGKNVQVTYQSVQGSSDPKQRSGEVILVELFNDDTGRFQFYDAENERKIEVTVKDTIEDSVVRSLKTENWSTIGYPVRIVLSDNESMPADQAFILSRHEGTYDAVLAAAHISFNKKIIQKLFNNDD